MSEELHEVHLVVNGTTYGCPPGACSATRCATTSG